MGEAGFKVRGRSIRTTWLLFKNPWKERQESVEEPANPEARLGRPKRS